MRAHWRHLGNTIELVQPSAHWSPQPKWQMDRFSRFCTAYGTMCLYFTMGTPIHIHFCNSLRECSIVQKIVIEYQYTSESYAAENTEVLQQRNPISSYFPPVK